MGILLADRGRGQRGVRLAVDGDGGEADVLQVGFVEAKAVGVPA